MQSTMQARMPGAARDLGATVAPPPSGHCKLHGSFTQWKPSQPRINRRRCLRQHCCAEQQSKARYTDQQESSCHWLHEVHTPADLYEHHTRHHFCTPLLSHTSICQHQLLCVVHVVRQKWLVTLSEPVEAVEPAACSLVSHVKEVLP